MTLKEKLEHRKYLQKVKKSLYQKYCTKDNPYRYDNQDRIDYVVDHIVSQLILQENPAELEALSILSNRGINVKYQEPIPILSEGGKIERLYVADMVIGNTIIEIDGSSHDLEKLSKDILRDEQTTKAGYITKRFHTSEVYKLKEETFN